MKKTILIPIDTTINNPVIVDKLIKIGDTLSLTIKIYENGVSKDLSNETVDITLKKSDGKIIETGAVTTLNNVLNVNLGVQASNVSGEVTGEIAIGNSNNEQLTTNSFTFTVSNAVAEVIIPTSVDDIQTLIDLVNTISNANLTLENYRQKIDLIAGTDDTLEALINIKAYIDNNLEELESKNAVATVNNNNLQESISTANDTKDELDSANTQAEKNIEAMKQFGDVTELSQTVQANKTKLDKFTEDDNGDLLYNGEKISADSTADAVTTTPISGLAGDSNVQNCLELLNSKIMNINGYTGNKTYYVDATNGDDTNDGLTTDTPFKTMGKAWKMIPTFFSSVYTIKIIGDYSDTVFFEPKIATEFSNRIIIMSNDESNISTITGSWYFININAVGYGTSTIYAGLYLGSLKFVGAGIQFYGCKEGYVNNCIFDGTTSMTNFVYVYNSNVTVSKNTFTGKTSSGLSLIYATRHSSLYSYSNTYNTSKIATACHVNSNITSNSDTFTSITTNNTKDGSSNFTKN